MKRSLLVTVIEDDEATREMLKAVLEEQCHIVHTAATITGALESFSKARPDLIVLDRGLPDGDGIQLALRIRRDPRLRAVPILMLTGRSEPSDRVLGLRMGADDYLAKPFNMDEFLARAAALLRRAQGYCAPPRLACAGIVLELESRRVLVNGDEVKLGKVEYDLLRILMERAGGVLSRGFLLELVWKAAPGATNHKLVDVTVMNLRRKLGSAGAWITAVRSAGYMMRDPSK